MNWIDCRQKVQITIFTVQKQKIKSFISEYNPNNNIISVLVSNYGDNVWREMREIREELYKY